MADLTKLSDSDLAAIAAGDMGKVSDEGLTHLAGDTPSGKNSWLGFAKEPEEGNLPRPLAAAGARYGIPLAGQMGGPVGAITGAMGESTAQAIEGKSDPGAVAQSAAINAVPLSKLAGIKGVIENAIKLGGTSALAQNIKSLIDSGQLSSGLETAMAAAPAAAIPGVAALVGKLAKPVASVVTPEEAVRVRSLMNQNASRDAALEAGKRQGMVIVPSMVNPDSKMNAVLESVGGMGATKNAAKVRNDMAAAAAAREHAGIGPDVTLSLDSLNDAREPLAAPYEKVRQLGEDARRKLDGMQLPANSDPHAAAIAAADPVLVKKMEPLVIQAGADIEKLKDVRNQASLLHTDPAAKYDYGKQKAAQALDDQAAVLEQKIEDAVRASDNPGLFNELVKARTEYAKTYDVQRVLNNGAGSVNTQKIAAAYQKNPGKMTGPLADVGQFSNTFKDVVGTGKVAMDPGNSGTNVAIAPVAAAAGKAVTGNVAGAALGGFPLLRGPARSALLSDFWQSRMARPNYTPKTSVDPALVASILRELELANAHKGGRQ